MKKSFVADLHVHSRFSRATAKDLTLKNLYVWSQLKGVRVVATGDVTHPEWFAEIENQLVPAEPGLFKLRDDIAASCDVQVPDACRGLVRFMLEAEISNIYKADGRTRKNHNLVYLPDLDSARKLIDRLSAIGNLAADGRPILGLDARDLLEIALSCHEHAFLVPAHIWTPWFSMLGSKSGFDSVAECFRDLADEIFAVETGLSSDAPMNWRISDLDSRTLMSNSDAHSPANLGRNANRFHTDLSFAAIRDALRRKDPARCLGTIDLFPEEGKYHMDGHRKCGVCQAPAASLRDGGACPVCGKPLVLGVLHRVETLADRPEGAVPENALPHRHIIPLAEILSELLDVGPKSKKVGTHYAQVLEALGPEMAVLLDRSIDAIDGAGVPLLAEAIRRMREETVHITPGYDGEYGVIRVFTPEERQRLSRQRRLFDLPAPAPESAGRSDAPAVPDRAAASATASGNPSPATVRSATDAADYMASLNPPQQAAVHHDGGPLLIVAGPGTGKTRTLTCRAAYLVREREVPPDQILAVTFTRKAAGEMADRLATLMGDDAASVPKTATFHRFCRDLLAEIDTPPVVIDEDLRMALVEEAVRLAAADAPRAVLKPADVTDRISLAKQAMLTPEDDLTEAGGGEARTLRRVYAAYQELLGIEDACDYDDLIFRVVRRLEEDAPFREALARRYPHVLVDEYQDLNQAQYRLVRHLAPAGAEICVIGDPDQAIYGFRGADVRYFERFQEDYPGCRVIRLERNYRSTETILTASRQMIGRRGDAVRTYSGIQGAPVLTLLESATEKAEAVAIGKQIESLVGGTGFHSLDFGNIEGADGAPDRAFSDIAVLYRSHAQAAVLAEVLTAAGIPCQVARRRNQYGRKGVAETIAMLKIAGGVALFHDLTVALSAIPGGPGRSAIQRLKRLYYARPAPVREILASGAVSGMAAESASFQNKMRACIDHVADLAGQLAGRPVSEAVARIMAQWRLEGIAEKDPEIFKSLLRLADRCGENWDRFLGSLAFQTDADLLDGAVQKVALLTLHAAKGLEFPIVFIAGCEDGLTPFRKTPGGETDMAEERRLFYVGMTRAGERLFLSRARKRTLYGKTEARQPSPFLQDIETALTALVKAKASRPKKKSPEQLNLFS